MQYSKDRILTTHTGSLPRPPALLSLYGRRIRGETVDESEIDRAGFEAMRHVVQRQIECGLDIVNNGEQQREGFFLYVERRMSGFGGRWKRWPRGDYENYPLFREMTEAQLAVKEGASGLAPPRVVGEVRYLDPARADVEPREFKTTLAESPPRAKTSSTPTTTPTSKPWSTRCGWNTRRWCARAFYCRSIAPISRWNTTVRFTAAPSVNS
jgi:5-methyltetrahydropteroyltriglutamate--homocysteine methyltransferase